MGKFTEQELASFTDKDSKKPEYRELYESTDFITAYGKHTDGRIEADGPELAIGAKKDGQQDWDIHGERQLHFLKSMGMEPHHHLVDLGCGTGRLAEQAIPYLDPGHYVGVDISEQAIARCWELVNVDGFDDKVPTFRWSRDGLMGLDDGSEVDFVWAHSVFTHLPIDRVTALFEEIATLDFTAFCFTFKRLDTGYRRSGLKQFQYGIDALQSAANEVGLKAEFLEHWEWPAGQKTMKVTQ